MLHGRAALPHGTHPTMRARRPGRSVGDSPVTGSALQGPTPAWLRQRGEHHSQDPQSLLLGDLSSRVGPGMVSGSALRRGVSPRHKQQPGSAEEPGLGWGQAVLGRSQRDACVCRARASQVSILGKLVRSGDKLPSVYLI